MHVYLVGGAVRDKLLGFAGSDRDWVVVGATVAEMVAQGYRQVGKDFPVFLHPETNEEYALARTEKKTGKGYYGFVCHAAPDVTLEEDLQRRDLTVNAMAEDEHGNIIDPYNGQQDLQNKFLRHVSYAFVEDPVRVLRLARFAAKLSGFKAHESTVALVKEMHAAGELENLVPERVWREMERALLEKHSARFFEVLQQCGVLDLLLQPLHLKDVDIARLESVKFDSVDVGLALLLFDKPIAEAQQFFERLKSPKEVQDSVIAIVKYHSIFAEIAITCDVDEIIKLFRYLDVLRRPQRLQQYILICEYLYPDIYVDVVEKLNKLVDAYRSIDVKSLVARGLSGSDLAKEIAHYRKNSLINCLGDLSP